MSWTRPPARVKEWTADELPGARVPMQPLRIEDGKARMVISLPKLAPKRSEQYRRWVASLACAHCGRAGPSQCAHSDAGTKGMRLKDCDSRCYPLCADAPIRQGCHSMIGASGSFTREQRRTLEKTYGYDTKLQAINDGKWPGGWE